MDLTRPDEEIEVATEDKVVATTKTAAKVTTTLKRKERIINIT